MIKFSKLLVNKWPVFVEVHVTEWPELRSKDIFLYITVA